MGATHTVLHGKPLTITIGLVILCVLVAVGYLSHIRGLVVPHYLRPLAPRYRGTHVWFLTVDVALDILMGMAAGWQPVPTGWSDGQGLVLQFIALIVLLNLHTGMIYYYRPYNLTSHLRIEIAFSTLVTVVLVLRLVGVQGSSEVLIIGAVFILIMYGYILLVGTKGSDEVVTDVAMMQSAAAPYNPYEESLHDRPREVSTSPPSYQHVETTSPRRTKDEDDTQFMYDLLVPMKAPSEKRQRDGDHRIEL